MEKTENERLPLGDPVKDEENESKKATPEYEKPFGYKTRCE